MPVAVPDATGKTSADEARLAELLAGYFTSNGMDRRVFEECWPELFSRLRGMAFHFLACAHGLDGAMLDDVVQETLLRLLRYPPQSFRSGPEGALPYLLVATKHTVFSMLKRWRGKLCKCSLGDLDGDLAEEFASAKDDPARTVANAEIVARVEQLLHDRKFKLLKRYLGGRTTEELGRELNRTRQCINDRLHLLLKKLRYAVVFLGRPDDGAGLQLLCLPARKKGRRKGRKQGTGRPPRQRAHS